jgi:TonB family protein
MRARGVVFACALTAGLVGSAGLSAAQPTAPSVPPTGVPAPQRDLYPIKLAALIHRRLPPMSLAPGTLSPRAAVRVTLDGRGVPTAVELVRPSGHATFDAAVLDALAQFTPAQPMPLPTDDARRADVTGAGLVLEVFANAAVVPAPAPPPSAP